MTDLNQHAPTRDPRETILSKILEQVQQSPAEAWRIKGKLLELYHDNSVIQMSCDVQQDYVHYSISSSSDMNTSSEEKITLSGRLALSGTELLTDDSLTARILQTGIEKLSLSDFEGATALNKAADSMIADLCSGFIDVTQHRWRWDLDPHSTPKGITLTTEIEGKQITLEFNAERYGRDRYQLKVDPTAVYYDAEADGKSERKAWVADAAISASTKQDSKLKALFERALTCVPSGYTEWYQSGLQQAEAAATAL
ncbi:MAG: hypothetical protein KDD62_00420 [Bdellovibrionales bacterium]|nr:hypothetical protein [Bdellovibrionales bacterium]